MFNFCNGFLRVKTSFLLNFVLKLYERSVRYRVYCVLTMFLFSSLSIIEQHEYSLVLSLCTVLYCYV